MLYIADIKVNVPVILAPMAGITDYPFRQIARDMGCELLYTEMISSKGIIYGNSRTEDLIDFQVKERGLIGVQIFGESAEYMSEAAAIIAEKYSPHIIDINMGCPVAKVTKNGAGAALMKKPELAGEIIKSVVNSVQIPVTVKIRKGWDNDHTNAVNIACLAETEGASAVTVHGRMAGQFYCGKADWGIIKEVKESVNIPVVGNGDIFTPQDAENMLEKTGCDAVMLGRGVRGNPWLLQRCIHYLQKGEILPEPDWKEKIEMTLHHLELAVEYFGEEYAIPRMRKHITWYLKGIPFSAEVKNRINHLAKLKEVKQELKQFSARLTEKLQ